jgi:hypothetical protein
MKPHWILEYQLKSGTRVRTIPLSEDIADRTFEDCLRRGERAVLFPVLQETLR